MARSQVRKEQIRAALQESCGNIADAARILGLSRRTVERYVQNDPDLRLGLDFLSLRDADEAWAEHLAGLKAGQLASIVWHLENQNYVVRPKARPMTAQEREAMLLTLGDLIAKAKGAAA